MRTKSKHQLIVSRTFSRANSSSLIAPTSEFRKKPTLYPKPQFSDLWPLLLFFIVYLIDHGSPNIILYPIYLVPILWMSSKWGWMSGVVFSIFAAWLSTPISPLLPWSSNQEYITSFAARSITLSLLSILYSNYTSLARAHKYRHDSLKLLVHQCPDCGAIYCRDGQWRSLDEIVAHPSLFGKLLIHDCHVFQSKLKP